MPKVFKAFFIIAVSVFLSCSEDEGLPSLDPNGYTFNSQYYVLNKAYVLDENIIDETPSDISITLANVNLVSANSVSNVTKVYFNWNGINLEPETYTNFLDYSIEIESYFEEDGTFVSGTFLLDSSQPALSATETSVTVHSISDTNISLTFVVTRNDGQVFSGHYSGLYSNTSATQ